MYIGILLNTYDKSKTTWLLNGINKTLSVKAHSCLPTTWEIPPMLLCNSIEKLYVEYIGVFEISTSQFTPTINRIKLHKF